jgi:hypothetical protein
MSVFHLFLNSCGSSHKVVIWTSVDKLHRYISLTLNSAPNKIKKVKHLYQLSQSANHSKANPHFQYTTHYYSKNSKSKGRPSGFVYGLLHHLGSPNFLIYKVWGRRSCISSKSQVMLVLQTYGPSFDYNFLWPLQQLHQHELYLKLFKNADSQGPTCIYWNRIHTDFYTIVKHIVIDLKK